MRSEVAQSTAVGQNLPEIEEVEELNVEGSKESALFHYSTFRPWTFRLLRRLVELQESARRAPCRDWVKNWRTPSPLPQRYVPMLLITKARRSITDPYPTMYMIISYLVQNSQKRPIYFHWDKLWISPEAWKNRRRTHDVYHWKGVNTRN
jgi:hypothetical protein